MKKLLIALLALGTLSIVPAAEAGRRSSGSCHKAESCHKPCAPKCEPVCNVEEYEEEFFKDCMVSVPGKCPYKKCTKVKTCTSSTDSTKCTGPCVPNCESGARE
jgi:hypothetical protein